MTPLDNLRRLVAGWRGQWRVDAHEGITLSHDGDEWPIGALDGDAVIALVELLNAIRPAVDGATAEIARLTAELADLRAQVHAEARSHAATRADLAVAVHELGEVTRAYHVANDAIGEVCRLVGAESTPGAADVAGNDASRKRDAVAKVQALVEASQPATVGGMLATAPVGLIEFRAADEELHLFWQVVVREGAYGASDSLDCRFWNVDEWEAWRAIGDWRFPASNYRRPARLVPADLADADPATRGPIGEVPDAR